MPPFSTVASSTLRRAGAAARSRRAVAALAAAALALAPGASLAARRAKPKPAAPAAPAPLLTPAALAVERHVLDNGLVVLLAPDRTVPAVTLWQWFKVGSRNERPGITGISHVLEHMMFNGSANVPPKEYDRLLEAAGGASNAFTARDMTAYHEDIASDRLDVPLRLDADRMASLSLHPEQLASEIEVVKEERRAFTDNDVRGLLDEHLWATAFLAAPYRWPIVGWMADLEAIRREDCVEYFRTYYAPNNCILVLVGDFAPAQALKDIRAAFGGIPRQAPPPPPPNGEPEQRGERRVEVHHPAETVTFMAGYRAPGATHPDVPALDVLVRVLADGPSSRLHRALVMERGLALEADAAFEPTVDPGLVQFTVTLAPGTPAAAGLAAFDSVLARLAADGPDARELEKARNLIEADFVKGLKTNNGRGLQLGLHEHVYGDWRAMFTNLERVRAVTADDCRRVARAVFDARRRTVATLVPAGDAAAAVR